MLSWANQFNIFSFLDNQEYSFQPYHYECLLAVGSDTQLSGDNLQTIDSYLSQNNEWLFGHLSYDLKNHIYNIPAKAINKIGFPEWLFFKPEVLFLIKENELTLYAEDPEFIFQQIQISQVHTPAATRVNLTQRYSKDEYIRKVNQLKAHIKRGDCYEINFCQEFYSENVSIDPLIVFSHLMQASPNPFSALYKHDDKYLICASPERFLTKQGNKLISQPMKGTIRRGKDFIEDEAQKNILLNSKKDQAENIMVVDLVRNDLSRICTPSSVKVEELNGVYSFPKVHQMISTVSGILSEQTNFSDIIDATFPMGSMTGAPKYKVMELIDEFEYSNRGLFSGSVGYIDPEGNFDFNVVIRSILYNQTSKYLSYFVGSGITFNSDPESEWEECLLKGEAIKQVLSSLSAA